MLNWKYPLNVAYIGYQTGPSWSSKPKEKTHAVQNSQWLILSILPDMYTTSNLFANPCLWASRLTEPITVTSYGEVQTLVHVASNNFTDCWLTNAPWSRSCMFHAPWYTVHYSTTWCPSLDVPGAHCTNKIYIPRQCTASFFKFNWKKKQTSKPWLHGSFLSCTIVCGNFLCTCKVVLSCKAN